MSTRRLPERCARRWGCGGGPPLAELARTPFAPAEIARLEEERLAALELRIQADLAAGRHAELVGELGRLIREHPLRERLREHHMLALYRSGRQAEALDAYRQARAALVEQLGIEPGDELVRLHRAILAHDPRLVLQSLEPATPSTKRAGPLPRPPNRTIGREDELATIAGRFRRDGVRLLTLTGPGGVGKTRLALEVGYAVEPDFADGACFVALAGVKRVEDVPATTVRALGAMVLDGESAQQAAERFLTARRLLLVVDNCEHLDGVAEFLASLLHACPGLVVLATSREPLGLRAEERHPVPPLAVHGQGATAAALFVERARGHDPALATDDDGAAIAEICARLDGLPLAIELAAARCALLTPVEIAQRLGSALGSLGTGARDAPARQRTLRATIDWSYDLLDAGERTCFARFAVFAGGASVDAVESITGARLDVIDGLAAKSLLTPDRQPDGRTRLTMLGTIREYGLERLAAEPDAAAVRRRHYDHFLSLAERSGTEQAVCGKDRREHLGRLDADAENLHVALGWAIDAQDAGSALTMCVALAWFWRMQDRSADAARWIGATLELPGVEAHPALLVRALCAAAWAAFPVGRREEGRRHAERAMAVAVMTSDPALRAEVLESLAWQAIGDEELALADGLADDALDSARRSGDEWRLAMAAIPKALAARTPADLRERVDRAAALLERVGNAYYVADLHTSAAYAALCLASDADAAEFVARVTPAARDLDHPSLSMLVRGNTGLAALFTGDLDAAREAFRDELEYCRELAVLPVAAEGLRGLAAVAAERGDLERAALLEGAAEAQRYGQPRDPVYHRLRAVFLDPARTRLGDEAWDAGVRRGVGLSFEEAITEALAERRAATA